MMEVDPNGGHVRVYQYSGSSWSQLGADIDGEAAYDSSGHSVSLSSDGTESLLGSYNGWKCIDQGMCVFIVTISSMESARHDIDGEAAGDNQDILFL